MAKRRANGGGSIRKRSDGRTLIFAQFSNHTSIH
jgi:hypothetical protein